MPLTFFPRPPGLDYEKHRQQAERGRGAPRPRIARAAAEHGYVRAYPDTSRHEHVVEPRRSILNSVSRGADE